MLDRGMSTPLSSLSPSALVWLRRDFRWIDQTAIAEAAQECGRVSLAFVIDPRTLAEFTPKLKPHAAFFGALLALRAELQAWGKDILLMEGDPAQKIPELCRMTGATHLYYNKDYEPAALERDRAVTRACHAQGTKVKAFKDQSLFEESEVLNGSDAPYKVFTAYKNACFKRLKDTPPQTLTAPHPDVLVTKSSADAPGERLWKKLASLVEKGCLEAGGAIPPTGEKAAQRRLSHFIETALPDYSIGRNLPDRAGTSRISMDLRAGTLSPRQVWNTVTGTRGIAPAERDVFLAELIWRDFFMTIGFHFPRVFDSNYNEKYDRLKWRNDESEFQAWCQGRTGYPIVDAGMRELVQTGFMHNRVRMITAMFLVKDLLVDWKMGERFFRSHLVDGDAAVNNGNWQWCASTGCDAQPYFRIFNPTTQGLKFDGEGGYIRTYLPELGRLQGKKLHTPPEEFLTQNGPQTYPPPLVDHSAARMRCLTAFNRALAKA